RPLDGGGAGGDGRGPAVIEPVPAGLGRRVAARGLDAVLGGLVWGLTAMWLGIGAGGFRRPALGLGRGALLAPAGGILGVLLHVVYHVAFVGGCGQTPGGMALGIAVVRRDGERAGYARAAIRCLAGILSILTLGLTSIALLWSRERRGFADWLAGTRVVR